MSSNVDLLSYKDLPNPPSSSKSSKRPCSTTQPNKSTEHSAIQKGSITALWLQLTLMVCYLPQAISANLISKTELSSSFIVAVSYTVTLVFLNATLNPFSLLLENNRGETGNEGNDQANTLLLNHGGTIQSLNWPRKRTMAKEK